MVKKCWYIPWRSLKCHMGFSAGEIKCREILKNYTKNISAKLKMFLL
jgi:hypothetical protein